MKTRITLVAAAIAGWLPGAWAAPQLPSYYVHEEQSLASLAPIGSEVEPGDFFGRCVATSGNRLVVGAENAGASDFGSAYVFVRAGTDWTFEAELTAGDENFGRCVAISGATIVVGATGNATNGLNAGAVHVYSFDGMSWVPQATPLIGTGVASGDHFGSSVAIDGDLIVVGARLADVAGPLPDAGRVHVFERLPMATTWTEQTGSPLGAMDGLTPDAESFDEFGHSVAIYGSTIVVGAPREDVGLADDSGAAYVYERVGTDWIAAPKILPTSRFAFSLFGDCVSVHGDVIAVGAPLGLNGVAVSGSVSLFDRSGTTWTENTTFSANDSADNDRFGDCLSLGDQKLVVGAWNDLHQHQGMGTPFLAVGSAYLFEIDAQTMNWTEAARFCPSVGLQHGRFGSAVSFDVDRVAVGAWQVNALAGDAHVFHFIDPAPVDHCSGDGGNQSGCTNCPCSNNSPAGTIGGCLNSAMTSARISATGDPSVSLPNGSTTDLRFSLSGAPPNAFSILNSGNNVAPLGMGNPCFGMMSGVQSILFDGLRCAVQGVKRHGGRAADSNGDVGVTTPPWGGEGGPFAGIARAGGGFSAGQTRFFQVTHREDPLVSCMRGLNTSQAVEISFVP